jgi:serine/threonine protein kinase
VSEQFGPYTLLTLLGRGGMGEVWRAHDNDTDRVVALKLLPSGLADDDLYKERFLREAQIVSKLNNPFIVPIHRYGTIDDRLYVDMRLVEGRDLAALLDEGPLAPERAVAIVEQIAKALNAAHRLGLVHRDVKPSNVLVTDDDFAYLIDFGIAQDVNRTGLTGTGNVIGTWSYMAPERMTTVESSGPSSDIYSLACVLHECLTATKPFPGDSIEIQVAAHLHAPPPRPSLTAPHVPPSFDPVVDRGMAKDPRARYATTLDLAGAARHAVDASAVAPPAGWSAPPTAYGQPPTAYATPPPQTWPPHHPPGPAARPKPGGSKAKLITGVVAGVVVLVVAAVIAVIAVTGGDDSGSGATASSSGSQPADAPGGPVTAGPLQVTVTGHESVTNIQGQTPSNGQFYLVHLTVRNDGDTKTSLLANLNHLVAGDMTYQGDAGVSAFIENGFLPTIEPGQEMDTSIAFDVPKNIAPTAIDFDPDLLPGDTVRIPLP